MTDTALLGPWVRRFLLEHLVGERNLARNTQQSYRDAVRLLVVFAAAKTHKKVDQLLVPDIDADLRNRRVGARRPAIVGVIRHGKPPIGPRLRT